MALVLADRVRDTTTTTGTGTITLSGTAPTGYQNFSVVGNGNTTYYTINAASQWEVGIGTYSSTGPTLSRDTVLASSNAGSLVSFSSGTKDVFITYPAEKSVNQNGSVISAGSAVLGVANGGTGAATLTGYVKGSGTSAFTASATIPTSDLSGTISLTSQVSGTLPVGNGGTGATSLTANGVLYGNGTSAVAATAAGTTGQVLVGNTGGAPSWATLSGIGVTSFSAGTTGFTPSTGTTGAVTLAGTLNVANGGTGATSLSSGYLLKGNGTSAVSASVVYDNGTNVGIGTSSPGVKLDVIGTVRSTSFSATGTTAYQPQTTMTNWAADATGGYYIFYKGRASGTTSQSGDTLGTLLWYGYDSANTAIATSSIFTTQTAAAGAGSVPSALVFANGGNAERMRITSAGDVGIGTSSPAQKLDVNGQVVSGNITIRGDGSEGGQVSLNDKANAGTAYYFDVDGSGHGRIFTISNNTNLSLGQLGGTGGVVTLSTSSTERMRIDSSGNANIGAQGATSAGGIRYLDVYNTENTSGSSGADVRLITQNAAGSGLTTVDLIKYKSGAFYISNAETSSGGIIGFNTSSTERMRIDSAGSVGIGTSSPSVKLDVAITGGMMRAGGASGNNLIQAYTGSNGLGMWAGGQTRFYSTGDITFSVNSTLTTSIPTGYTDAMTITSAGNVGIGTSSPASLLHVKRGSNATEVYPSGTWAGRIINATDSSGENGLLVGNRWAGTGSTVFEVGSIFGGGTGSWFSYYRVDGVGQSIWSNQGTERMRLDTSGNLLLNTTTAVQPLTIGSTSATSAGVNLRTTQTDFSIVASNSAAGGVTIGTSWVSGGQGPLIFTQAAGERMRIDSSGNLGLGTSSPGARLDVAGGSIRLANNQGMTFRNTAGTGTATYVLQNDDNFVVYNAAGTPIQSFSQGANSFAVYGGNANNRMVVDSGSNITYWLVNGSERMRINSSGEVLMGTSTGGRAVCMYASDMWLRLSNASRQWLIGPSNGSNFNIWDETGGYNVANFDTAGSFNLRNSMYIGSGQNLDNKIEIGSGRTGNNYAYIDLIGDTTYTDYGLRLIRSNGGPNTTSELIHRGTGDMYISTQDGAPMLFRTSSTTRFYIEATGSVVYNNLLVGRTSSSTDVNAANDTGSFSVRGDTTKVAAMSFHRAGAYAINMGLGLDAVLRIGGWSASSNCFQMDGSGNLTMLGNVTAYSDARMKKDVETIDNALDLVSKMRGVRYTRTDTNKRGTGVIAQEMLEVMPEVVQQGIGDDDTLSVAYGNLVGVLIEAVKELTARVAELEGK